MKKTIITSLVAVAAFGFSGTSFAGGSITNVPVFHPEYESTTVDNDVIAPDLFSHNTSTSTFAPTSTSTFAPVFAPVNASTNINAAPFGGPAAGGDQVVYDIAPIALTVSPTTTLDILPALTTLTAVSTATPAGSGNAPALAGLTFGTANAAAGDTGNVSATAGAATASIGNISPDLSTSATSLIIIGGSYSVAP